jgi:uncharacterized membrane protein
MTLEDVLKISAAILASVGGAGIIVVGLSSFLGKVWANRIMESDRAKRSRARGAGANNRHDQSNPFRHWYKQIAN